MTECFWCNEVYDNTNHDTCPNCATDTNTKEIKTVKVKSTESK